MRSETILKIVLVLTIGVLLFAMPIKVSAEPVDMNNPDFWEDQGELEDLPGGTTTPEPTTPATPETEKPEEKLPEAGLVEDTIMVITIVALIAMATFAYKKVNEYDNI